MLLQGSFSYKFTVFVIFAVNSWVEKTDIACHALYWPNMHYANIPHQTAVLHHQALSFWLANQSISPVINLLTPVSLTLASPLFTYINRTNTHQWPYQWYLSYQYTLSQQSIPSIKRIDPFMAFIPFTFLWKAVAFSQLLQVLEKIPLDINLWNFLYCIKEGLKKNISNSQNYGINVTLAL